MKGLKMQIVDTSKAAAKIIEYLGCPCEYFAPLKKDGAILAALQTALKEGEAQGFSPLLIVPDETLLENLLLDFGAELDSDYRFDPKQVAALRLERLEEAERVDAEEFLQRHEHMEPGPVEGDNILKYLSSHWDYDNNQTHEVILAKIPTAKPWELAAWLPMGGFNACPLPPYQVAVMKRWYETYEARPVLVSCDAWEFSVPQALADKAEALKLAYEHYAFCPDRVENYGREEYRLGNLADSLMKSKIWYFSWE